MRLFRFLWRKLVATPPQLILLDTFVDDTNGWVDATNQSLVLKQRIERGALCLDSSSPDMGVASSITSTLTGARDFTIEARLKVSGKGELAYACLNFGIAKLTPGWRTIAGAEVATDLGDTQYYFGYSDHQELLVAKWHKGVETYYHRSYNEAVEIGAYNELTITNQRGLMSYALNGEVIFSHKARQLKGPGVGFSVAPNAVLWVDYIKIVN